MRVTMALRTAPCLLLILALVPAASGSTMYMPEPYRDSGVAVWTCIDAEEHGCWQTLPNATVTVTDGSQVWTQTTQEHHPARFTDLPDGAYDVSVAHPAFTSGQATFSVPKDRDVQVTVGSLPVTISGLVVGEGEQPVQGATIRLHRMQDNLTATTDAQGRFEIDTRSGWYYASIESKGHKQGWADGLAAPGLELRWMLLDEAPRAATITGRVHDQDGLPVADADVTAWSYVEHWRGDFQQVRNGYTVVSDPWGSNEASTRTDAQGRYTLAVPVGHVELNAWADGYRGQRHYGFEAVAGNNLQDMELLRLPERTALVSGRVVDAVTGQPVPHAELSIRNVAYDDWACSQAPEETAEPTMRNGSGVMVEVVRPGYGHGCPITRNDDGTFEGKVMPGYSVVEVADHHCDEHGCQERYIRHVQTLTLVAGQNTFDIRLQPRPVPDAIVSGYILDAQGQPVPHARISFHNEELNGYGHAATDEHGSYRVKLRDGWHSIHVYAPGHFPWQGLVDAVSKKDTPLDVRLTQGEEGCCGFYGFPGRMPMPMMMPMPPMYDGNGTTMTASPGRATGTSTATGSQSAEASDEAEAASGTAFEDLGGGLGPYDPAVRQEQLEDPEGSASTHGVPGFVVAPAALALLWVVRRRW